MPEGPEAHTIARVLNQSIAGRYIVNITLREGHPHCRLELLQLPSLITSVSAYGKRIIFTTDRGCIVTFLALTGRWSYKETKHTNITLTMLSPPQDGQWNNSSLLILYYQDHLKYGNVTYHNTESTYLDYFSNIGVDLMLSPPTLQQYRNTLRMIIDNRVSNKRCKMPTLSQWLMNQEHYSGVGNYLKSEILYLSHLDPHRSIDSLSDSEVEDLHRNTLNVMAESYRMGGLTIKDYWSPTGEPGLYQCHVYNLKMDRHGNKVEKIKDKDGRSTYWVPVIQK